MARIGWPSAAIDATAKMSKQATLNITLILPAFRCTEAGKSTDPLARGETSFSLIARETKAIATLVNGLDSRAPPTDPNDFLNYINNAPVAGFAIIKMVFLIRQSWKEANSGA